MFNSPTIYWKFQCDVSISGKNSYNCHVSCMDEIIDYVTVAEGNCNSEQLFGLEWCTMYLSNNRMHIKFRESFFSLQVELWFTTRTYTTIFVTLEKIVLEISNMHRSATYNFNVLFYLLYRCCAFASLLINRCGAAASWIWIFRVRCFTREILRT